MKEIVKKNLQIALIGNPNTGKTTVFNSLCGLRQRTGNYPGVTVEKRVGFFETNLFRTEIYDLPGLYSLRINSNDEKITYEVLTGHLLKDESIKKKPDLILYIMDASNLKRNLYLLLQVMELNIPIFAVLTMTDVASKKGIQIDLESLKKKLNIPVIGINAKNKENILFLKKELQKYIDNLFNDNQNDMNYIQHIMPKNYLELNQFCLENIQKFLNDKNINYQCTRTDIFLCLTNSQEFISLVIDFIKNSNEKKFEDTIQQELTSYITNLKKNLERFQFYSQSQLIQIRYKVIDSILKDVVSVTEQNREITKEKIDKILTHKVFGLTFFVLIMAFVFQSIYTWAEPLMSFIESFFNVISKKISESGIFSPMMESFLIDGIITGVGSVIVFVPQIAILFFFIAIMEDSGYLARASFLMDKLMSWTGLNGRSFIPLISSFACAVPSIMATRIISDDKVRKTTILITPLMSCSARLPVYILFIGAFIEPKYGALVAGLFLFLMHSIGLIVAFFVSLIINKKILKTPDIPFVMELPDYHIPSLRNVYFRVYEAVKNFLKRAGTIIFAMSIIIWASIYFPHDENAANQHVKPLQEELERLKQQEELDRSQNTPFPERVVLIQQLESEIEKEKASFYLQNSYLGTLGRFIEPIFKPLGFDWKLSIGILSAFPARETIISTLGIIYQIGSDTDETSASLREKLLSEKDEKGNPSYNLLTAISLMIFFALCAQCMSTLAVIKKELGLWKYPIYVFLYMTLLAYFLSMVVYQIGNFFYFE
ncbi:MAG: ferrous iron transport protein B [Leptonema sp. (in: bacteria)]